MSKRSNAVMKFFDYYIGIPCVFCLGLFKQKNKQLPISIQRIMLLKTAGLGDAVILSAIIRDIRDTFPAATIILALGESNQSLMPFIPCVDEQLVLPIKRPWRAFNMMRLHSCDVLLDFGSWPRIDALLAFFSKSKWRAGFKTKKQGRHFSYHHTVEHLSSVHEIDNYRNLAASLGVVVGHVPSLHVRESVTRGITRSPYCVCHLCADGYNAHLRKWPLKYWEEVCRVVLSYGFDIYITGTAKDFDENQRLIERCGTFHHMYNCAAKTDMEETIDILSHAAVVISVNTGVVHMASAVGTPVVVLNGPTNPLRWGALGSYATNLVPRISGGNYLNLGFEYKKRPVDCMEHIHPQDVVNILIPLLSDNMPCE